ncbi:type II and III secretion system protein family protein [Sphingomonas bacterium]|uniref:type II and III secretion system protein family protein n=1 Tax=Sphingomonas bacterium TaxID=1895847 RepID=UPI001576D614|nr:type II and III secretion system protein family protein [Sphingomonas bacterium]
MRIASLPLAPAIAVALIGAAAVPVIAGPGRSQHPRQTAGIASMPPGTQHPTLETRLSIGEGQLITLPAAAANVWMSNPDVADVYINNPRQVHLFGKSFGEATMFAAGANGAIIYSASIRVSQNITSVDKMLQVAMPGTQIQVVMVGQMAVLTGTVGSPDDAATAKQLVTAYLNPGVDVSAANSALKIGVISRLKTATPLQVNLRVRFAEVSRSFVKSIGVNLTNRASGNPIFSISRGRQGTITTIPGNPVAGYVNGAPVDAAGAPIATTTTGGLPGDTLFTQPGNTGIGTTLGLAGHFLGADILSSLDLGETIGQVSTLAEPNVTTLSGETATFLAGGEIPIPVSQGLGAVSVEYKQYGVSIAYTPTVLSNGRISLRVRPEVSQLTSQGAVTISGAVIPALSTRRVETSAELGSGESLVIGGLLQNDHNNSITKTPGLGDVPILGALFRDNAFQRNETELVIVITPYLVKPVNANDIVLPTDGYQAPTDLARIFDGKLSGGRTGGDRPKPTIAPPPSAPAGGVPAGGPDGPARPAIGAVAPVPPADPDAEAADRKVDRRARKNGKAVPAAPGFSSN